MKKINTILALVAVVLLAVSALSYRESVRRAERFERGQKFLPDLNPDEIAEIRIEKGEDATHLRRDGDRFVVVGAGGYPAATESVNRFLKDVLALSLDKEVGSGEKLEQELELTGEEEGTLSVTFADGAGKEMTRFRVGTAVESGGQAIRRAGDDDRTIYLTSSSVRLSAKSDDYLQKEIVDVPSTDLATVEGPGFRLATEEGALGLEDVPAGRKEVSSQVNKVKTALTRLRFDRHHLVDAPEVQNLDFDREVRFLLDDNSGYLVRVATRDDRHYLQIEGFHDTPRVEITMEADEDEVREKSEILTRGDEIRDFNALHGSWVYEVSEATAAKFRVEAGELTERE